ncbi:unnamed protein product, partial [Prorocentrum cordatum]
DFKESYAKLRAMGACSRRKKSARPMPMLLGLEGKPLRSNIEVADRWLQHFSGEEAAPVIPFSDISWFMNSLPALTSDVTHNVDINIEDVPPLGITQQTLFRAKASAAGPDGNAGAVLKKFALQI